MLKRYSEHEIYNNCEAMDPVQPTLSDLLESIHNRLENTNAYADEVLRKLNGSRIANEQGNSPIEIYSIQQAVVVINDIVIEIDKKLQEIDNQL